MKTPKLPAGLEDLNIEVYTKDGRPRVLYNGRTLDFIDLPEELKSCFEADFIRNRTARFSIEKDMGIFDSDEQLEQYVMCLYGGFNKEADLKDGILQREFWDCGHHTQCAAEGKVCNLPSGPNGQLSPKEAQIARLVAIGKIDKEIAHICDHEITTLRTHLKRIFKKLGVNNRVEVCRWAEENILF